MITEKMLDALRSEIEKNMSPKRYVHTAEVEKMIERLGALYAPEILPELRAAALLHDLTKEYPMDRQLLVCADCGLLVSREDLLAPKTFHARTAAAIIPKAYPDFATETVLTAVRFHTTGRPNMSIAEKLLYLADYIDMSRTFADCVRLREYFFDKEPEKMSDEDRMDHLNATLILSFDMTIKGLLEDGAVVSADTFEARNYLIAER